MAHSIYPLSKLREARRKAPSRRVVAKDPGSKDSSTGAYRSTGASMPIPTSTFACAHAPSHVSCNDAWVTCSEVAPVRGLTKKGPANGGSGGGGTAFEHGIDGIVGTPMLRIRCLARCLSSAKARIDGAAPRYGTQAYSHKVETRTSLFFIRTRFISENT